MDINKKIFNKILAILIQKSFRAHMTLFQKLLQIYKCQEKRILMKEQTHRSMKQNIEIRNRSTEY